MIVYSNGRSFFTKKYDAEMHDRDGVVHKISISGREELADLLNGICALPENVPETAQEVVVEIREEIGEISDEHVPKFLRECWAKRNV